MTDLHDQPPDATPTERAWEGHAFRGIDGSLRTLVVQLVRALTGLTLAYLVARVLVHGVLDLDGTGARAVAAATGLHVVLSGTALFVTSARPIRRDLVAQRELILASEQAMVTRVTQQAFLRDVHDALDMGETEADALAVTASALALAVDGPAELLVADASRAHLRRAAVAPGSAAPGCGVETPWGCPAVRRGRTLRFDSSDSLAACPRLRDRGGEPCSAVCVPITILGTPMAVIHATGAVADGAWEVGTVEKIEGVAAEVGTRLGVLRAMTKSQLQAETDPLTGLLNRRAMEERVRDLRTEETGFALAMADLDHFKRLNDSFGHETGDRALRTFANILRQSVRDGDIVARHGGEEFVIVLPGLDALGAAPVLHRIREELRAAVGGALVPSFTVSIGVADSTWSSALDEVLRAADGALFEAKDQGRDRLVIADPPPRPDDALGMVGQD